MLSLQILKVLEENMGKRKLKIIKGYQAHSSAWGGDHVQSLEKEKIWSCFTQYFRELQKTTLEMGNI